MQAAHSFKISDQQLWLSPLKAIYWEAAGMLILSDLHFGKTGHFRKAGIGVPQQVYKNDLHRLFALVQHYQPAGLIIVGDFFHSVTNKEAELFARWRRDHPGLEIILVEGNHDILPGNWYRENNIILKQGSFSMDPFCFTHEWNEDLLATEGQYVISGHLHPGVRVSGAGRQSLRLPCFYFDHRHAILPAFGGFTGLATIEPSPVSSVFVIAGETIIPMQ